MKSNQYIARKMVTFHQWKGKGYAIFASLGKLIRIGKLAITITQDLTFKIESQSGSALECKQSSGEEDKPEYEQTPDFAAGTLLLSLCQFLTTFIFKTDIQPQGKSSSLELIYRILVLIKVRFLPCAENGLFYFNHP